jgi:hypothetical protein
MNNDDITMPSERTKLIEAMNQQKNAWLGIITEKLLSRKLLAFGVATWLFYISSLTEQSWMLIAMTYIGGQGLVDMAKTIKGS